METMALSFAIPKASRRLHLPGFWVTAGYPLTLSLSLLADGYRLGSRSHPTTAHFPNP